MDACSNLVESLKQLSSKSDLAEIRQTTIGVASSVSNVVGSLNAAVNSNDANTTNNSSYSTGINLQLTASFNKANMLLDTLTGILSARLALDQNIQIETKNMHMTVKKISANDLASQNDSQISLPNFCQMMKNSSGEDDCLGKVIVIQV